MPTDWTLSAAGPTPISGATGSAAVTNAPVHVGTYTLSESGPPGYTAGRVDAASAARAVGSQVTLVEGQTATCTIVNTADPGVWELTKLADPPSGTTVDPGAVITYTLIAAHESGSPISGATAADDLTQVLPFATVNTPLPAEPHHDAATRSRGPIPLDPGRWLGRRSASASPSTPTPAGPRCSTWPRRPRPTVTARRARPPTPCGSVRRRRRPPSRRRLPPAGTEIAGPVRWGALLLLSGCVLLILSIRRRRGPRPA